MGQSLSVREAMAQAGDQTRWHASHGRIVNGLTTGFSGLDAATWGLRPGRISLVAGEPDTGKTGLARGVATHTVLSERRRVLWVSLQQEAVDVARLLLANRAQLPVDKLRTGALTPEEWMRHDAVVDDFDLYPELDPDLQPTLGTFPPLTEPLRLLCDRDQDIDDVTEALHAMPSAALVVLDGFDRLARNTHARSWQEAHMTVLDRLEQAADAIDAHVMVLLDLDGWTDPDRRLQRRDFRFHSELLHRASVVMALHRDELHNDTTPQKGIVEVEFLRNEVGARATVKLAWVDHLRKMANLAPSPTRG